MLRHRLRLLDADMTVVITFVRYNRLTAGMAEPEISACFVFFCIYPMPLAYENAVRFAG